MWLATKLQHQVRQLDTLPECYGGVFCRSVTISEQGDELFTYAPPAGTYDLRSFLVWCNPAANGSSFLVRRAVYDQIGGFDESLPSLLDMEWLLRITRDSAFPLLQGTTQTLVRYRRRRGSISSDVRARMRALEDVVSEFDRAGDPLVWLRPALMAYRAGCLRDARRFGSRATPYGWHRLLRGRDGRRLLLFQLRHILTGARCATAELVPVGAGQRPADGVDPMHDPTGHG